MRAPPIECSSLTSLQNCAGVKSASVIITVKASDSGVKASDSGVKASDSGTIAMASGMPHLRSAAFHSPRQADTYDRLRVKCGDHESA